MKPTIQAFYDPATWTVSYVVFDESGLRMLPPLCP